MLNGRLSELVFGNAGYHNYLIHAQMVFGTLFLNL